MASYGYGLSKSVETTQGEMDIANITTGRLYFNILPSSVFYFRELDWWIANNLLYYAVDYPNIPATGAPKLLEVAQIGATYIFACMYMADPSYESGSPVYVWDEDLMIRLYCGDYEGEQTDQNPNGYRLFNGSSFLMHDIENIIAIDPLGMEIIQRTNNIERVTNYGFFATVDNDNQLYFVNSPRKVEPAEKQIGVIASGGYYYSRIYQTAGQGELMTGTEFVGVGSMPLYDISGEPITIELLPESVGTSNPSGGNGTYSIYSDNIDFPSLPTLGAANSGLLTLYNPTISELRQLSNWLWSNDLLDVLEKMYAQPMDLIVTLNIVPTEPSSLGNSQEVKIGGVDTNINMTKVNNQYAIIDCGQLNVKEYYGSALDYGQYTKVSIYLPFCNVVQLKTDEVMNGTLHVRYHVDLFNGTCIAFIKIIRQGLNSVLYSFEGNMAVTLPLISRDFSNLYQGIAKTGVNMLSGGFGLTDMLNSAINVMSSKPNVNRTGGTSATGGLLGIKKPYLIIERPIQSLASGYKSYVGYPSNITDYLYTLKGYTEVEEVICDTLKCTKEEQDAIVARLKSGVIL